MLVMLQDSTTCLVSTSLQLQTNFKFTSLHVFSAERWTVVITGLTEVLELDWIVLISTGPTEVPLLYSALISSYKTKELQLITMVQHWN